MHRFEVLARAGRQVALTVLLIAAVVVVYGVGGLLLRVEGLS